MAAPRVEMLWWAGCPSHGKAKAMLEEAMIQLGLNPANIESLQLITDADAAREHFIGSPTIRVNGVDIVTPDADDPPALTCRLYFLKNGRPSPTPDPEHIREALKRAIQT